MAKRSRGILAPVVLGILALLAWPGTVPAADGKVTVSKVEYRGWKNNLKLDNGEFELIVTLDVGPRIISYRLSGGQNVFKEYPEGLGKSGESEWMIRGGHRLWYAPEDPARTYALDNKPVAYRELAPGVVRFTPPADTEFGLQKEIDLHLAAKGTGVTVVQRIKNIGTAETELAAWSLSVMAPGGVEVIPLPPKRPHPSSPKDARSAADFASDEVFTAWSYFDFQDPRWHFGTKFITLRQDSTKDSTKFGLLKTSGGVGYLNGGTLFVKKFDYQAGKLYPDHGVNYETYTDQNMLELESLSPLYKLAPGASLEHTERWSLFGDLGTVNSDAEIEAKIAPKLK